MKRKNKNGLKKNIKKMKSQNKTHTFARGLSFNQSNDIHKGRAISRFLCFGFFLFNLFTVSFI